jgi:hypothetical protein
MDGYVQNIWGREPFYKRNADGSMALVDGRPVFNELEKTTLYGREFRLEKGEAERCLRDIYRQAVRMYLMHHHLAGQYPAHSGLRKPFLENVRVGAWTRVTNEGVLETVQNDRPLPGWLLELVTGLYLVTADDVVAWGVETNRPARPLGSDYTDAWTYASHGMYEFLIKAAHRYSALDPIHHGPFRWCWFNLPMINKNRTEGDFYYQKPLAIGKIRTYQGRPWLEFFAAYPAIDGQPTEMTLWVDNGGRRSERYSIRLADGRSYFYDAWQLPGEFRDIEGKHVWLRFIDPLGQSHTWRGDWREVAEKK